ncbi:SDR family oxidoreductase [Salipiger thiooxidans]|uniref:SDR family NAD(P)-dependent oxidoreductase n=1 Tax=Salipiger thiooxidans TaxID=282683 RepID=UPI001A8C0A17|nr:SDR family oxidoreductase [Salipiger thiooxidans]MBN8190151.1 SDR family oxidoreductase [Salipiger thiooxidans]
MKLENKVAIVTGGAQGIGEGIVRQYAAEGARVMIGDIQEDKAVALCEELGEDVCKSVLCDVSNSADVKGLIEATLAAWGRIDIAVCNSGINHNATILEIEEEDFDRVMAVNLKGAFLVGQACARWMAANEVQGAIVNMSSINAVVCSPTIVPYAVSKGGINQLTSVMALGLAPYGIRVNGVGPGSIETELLSKIFDTNPEAMKGILARTPMGRLGTADEIGRICVFLASEDSSYMTGQTIYADGGRLRLAYTVPVKD